MVTVLTCGLGSEDLNRGDRYKEGSKLAGVIYIHRISDRRFSGIAGRNFKVFRDLCGETSLKNVVLVTNMWGDVTHDVGEAREKELASIFLKPALDKGARMIPHHNTEQSAHDVIRHIVNNHPVVLQIQRELVDEHKGVANTTAGEAVNAELTEEIKRHEADLNAVREEMMRTLGEKHERARQMLGEETRRLEEEMCMVLEVSEEITLEYLQELEWTEMKMKHVEAQEKLDREQVEMEYQVQMTLLNSRLEAAEIEAEIERLTMQHQINRLQAQLNGSGGDDSTCVAM